MSADWVMAAPDAEKARAGERFDAGSVCMVVVSVPAPLHRYEAEIALHPVYSSHSIVQQLDVLKSAISKLSAEYETRLTTYADRAPKGEVKVLAMLGHRVSVVERAA
jgi:hypothetical protein